MKIKLHPSITPERVVAAVESRMQDMANPGFCRACGEDAEDCEPDAEGYECQSCGQMAVDGADNILLELAP